MISAGLIVAAAILAMESGVHRGVLSAKYSVDVPATALSLAAVAKRDVPQAPFVVAGVYESAAHVCPLSVDESFIPAS